jgi:hypothetical protein
VAEQAKKGDKKLNTEEYEKKMTGFFVKLVGVRSISKCY